MRVTLDGETFELTPERVRDGLVEASPENIRDYWVEIDGTRWPVKQVISLTTGVARRSRFQSQSARRWLTNLGFVVGSEGAHEQVPSSRTARTPRRSLRPVDSGIGELAARADVVLIGCVKSKRTSGAPAKDLYTSAYFLKMREYAERSGRPWFILSAEHGLVRPETWLDPYECYLPDMSRDYRSVWGARVAAQLEDAVGRLEGLVVDVHAGASYVESIDGALHSRGVVVVDQLAGLSFGRRLAWYVDRASPTRPVADVLADLLDPRSAMYPADFLASNDPALDRPGMYSWLVDADGSGDLSRGLGLSVDEGLIYAGLAGATRSGGSRSLNTLRGRVATMHLGSRHSFSTFRLSLGSILAHGSGQPTIDEAQLTRWMHAHLRVVTVPVADPDSLDELETALLAELDPPLNLAKMPRNPLRERLSALRKVYGATTSRQPVS